MPHAAAALGVPHTDGFCDGVFFVHMTVRDYELDQFGVVNNAVYAGYVQHARHRALAAAGLAVESFQAEGLLMAITEQTLRFKAPLRSGDAFVATAAIAAVGGARLTVDSSVLLLPSGGGGESRVVVEGATQVVFLDGRYRPVRVPVRARDALSRLQREYATGVAARVAQPPQPPAAAQSQ